MAAGLLLVVAGILSATGYLTPRTPIQDMERHYPVLAGVLSSTATKIRKAPSGQAVLSAFAGSWRAAAGTRVDWNTTPEYATAASLAAWNAGRQISFTGLPYAPWPVPQRPSWLEDPFTSQLWRQAYESLVWLRAPAYGYATTRTGAYADQVELYVLSWLGSTGPNTPDTWSDDGTVASRADTLVALYDAVLANSLAGQDLAQFIARLNDHGLWLFSYLRQHFSTDTQTLDDAISLLQLSVRFPQFAHARGWHSEAREVIARIVTDLTSVNPAFASLEDRQLANALLQEADPFLAQFNQGLTAAQKSALLQLSQ